MWCSTSRRRSPSRWSPWEAGRRAMTTSSTICRGAETRSAGQCEGPVHLRTLSKIRRWLHQPVCRVTNIHIIRLFRYGLYDFEYEHQCQGTTDSSKKQKLFLMSWCPDRWPHPPAAVWEDDIMFQRQDKEEDAVLLILRCSQEVSCRCAQIHPGIKTPDTIATPKNRGRVNH